MQYSFNPSQASQANRTPIVMRTIADASPFLASDPEKGDMHPDARRKPRPEFEGETNPSTGEIGGPKNDPLKYDKEWTYGGRATDF